MIQLKKLFYFPVAYYFRFFAEIKLKLWKPRIIVITGSSGKTTLLHLLESQIGNLAKYSHHANSAFGVPFDILDLKRKTLTINEWPIFFLLAPFKAFQKETKNLYIVEADCDRPGEGKFLSTLLKPEITSWLSSSKTHSVNFSEPVEENIAFEFGYFIENASKLVILNSDLPLIQKQIYRSKAKIENVTIKQLDKYNVTTEGTTFKIAEEVYKFHYALPKETFYQTESLMKILKYLNYPLDKSFGKLILPPGRSTVFKGFKNTKILDSSYNSDYQSMKVMLDMFTQISTKNKWVVLGDMVDQGSQEKEEHEKLATLLLTLHLDKIILIGPRLAKYIYPNIKKLKNVEKFDMPKDALNYLQNNINGGEMIMFKGARFLEGIIEHLLINKSDIEKLCRREKVWQKRRQKWGL